MKKFEIPLHYKSSIVSEIKKIRKESDPRKKDYTPTVLNFGPITFYIARHFGFCFGVENAIEIAYKTIEENPGKRIFLLSEMIHNPNVNNDLTSQGVEFIMDTSGKLLINWADLTKEDIVIVPAFGTTLEIESELTKIGIDPYRYNTTCPFVEKVWKTASSLGDTNFTVIVHGKHSHEETRATFSHSAKSAPSLIVRDLREAKILADVIKGKIFEEEFYELFDGKFSEGFDPGIDLLRIGVVNQTTMLASETEEISNHLKQTMISMFGADKLSKHFADTRDTLCYATNDNQRATNGLLETGADLAIVIGGYNSSNTSHLVELLEKRFTTYFISSADKIISNNSIKHYLLKDKREVETGNYLVPSENIKVVLTSGASCPDAEVDFTIRKLISYYKNTLSIEDVLAELRKQL